MMTLRKNQIAKFIENINSHQSHLTGRARIPALYVAGLLPQNSISLETIDEALESRQNLFKEIFADDADKKTATIRQLLHSAYRHARTSDPHALGRETPTARKIVFDRYPTGSDKTILSEPKDLQAFAIATLRRALSDPIGKDMAFAAGVLEREGSITRSSIQAKVFERKDLLNPDIELPELTKKLVGGIDMVMGQVSLAEATPKPALPAGAWTTAPVPQKTIIQPPSIQKPLKLLSSSFNKVASRPQPESPPNYALRIIF